LFTFVPQVHAHEMFVDGCFNGDPHPGTVAPHPLRFPSMFLNVTLFQATFCFFQMVD
jgi:hypothetical protein